VAALFPAFLKLKNRICLVVGGGEIAEGKIAGLLTAGGDVRVVAPKATQKIKRWAQAGKIRWMQREFRDADLDGSFIVVAATSSNELHRRIFRLARASGVLCNVVDVPELCDFYYPSVVRRGALQIAISTSGESPALAQRLRKKLEKEFGPEYADWLKELGEARRKLRARSVNPEDLKEQLHSMVTEKVFRAFAKKNMKSTGKRTAGNRK
jgi:precorrin-2 dehydrogenase/sirohydrochlorin ferrochelatase